MGSDGQALAGVVLAGGLSRRMGGADKALVVLWGETLVERALRRLRVQVGRVAVNSNADPVNLPTPGEAPVLHDIVEGYAGPLAGVHAALSWARAEGCERVVTVAVDTPFFPDDLVARLNGPGLAVAASGGRLHPIFACWPVALEAQLAGFLGRGGARMMDFLDEAGFRRVEWPVSGIDPFFNINTPADLAEAEGRS